MKIWNNLIEKVDLLLQKIKLGSAVKIAGREIPPVYMGFALIVICIPILGYLEIEGKKEKVIPRDVSYHVVSEKPAHIDFMRIIQGSKVILEIPVIFKNNNDSPGLKKGGVLNIVRRKVQLECKAENIPENIIVDLSGLDIGASVKISSVKLPENAKPTITDRDFVVATIAPPTIVKEPEKPTEEAAAEGADGEAATSGETAEAASGKEGEAEKKDDKGKEQSGDKKPAPDKKTPDKKEKK